MTFSEHVFRYCERGTSDALLAEPINVISNLAFLFAALIGLQLLLWRPREERSADHYLLVFLVLAIGLGSLAFHLFATEGTELLDVVPIGLFMLVYLGFALNCFLGVPVGLSVLLVIGFTAIMAMTGQVQCWDGGVGLPGPEIQGAKPCLNGSVFYLPALMALIVVGLLAEERRHRAAPYLLWAAAILAVSITLRSLDFALCDRVLIARAQGRHPFCLASPERPGAVSPAAGEPRRGSGSAARTSARVRTGGDRPSRGRGRAPGSGRVKAIHGDRNDLGQGAGAAAEAKEAGRKGCIGRRRGGKGRRGEGR